MYLAFSYLKAELQGELQYSQQSGELFVFNAHINRCSFISDSSGLACKVIFTTMSK
jgi:hypothetical protein